MVDFLKRFFQKIYEKRTLYRSLLISILVLVFFIILTQRQDEKKTSIELSSSAITFSGPTEYQDLYRTTIAYSDITSIQLTDDFTAGSCIDGCSNNICQFGQWKNDSLGIYFLYRSPKLKQNIIIISSGQTIVFNYESDEYTVSLYEAILETISK